MSTLQLYLMEHCFRTSNTMRAGVSLATTVALLLCAWVVAAATDTYDTRGKSGGDKITIHFVPHTHDDVGWLKTVDQYHYGANRSIQDAGTRFIISSVVQDLLANPDRKFTYVEIAYFFRWWNEQSPKRKEQVRELVRNGQLQFANGGWCMHDEANPHYIDMIDQTTLGHRFLKNALNAIPKVGWQIDPFGHSATQASLLTYKTGFDALFFARMDYQDYAYRAANRNLEYIWQPSPAMGPDASIYTGVLYGPGYNPPYPLWFDWLNGPTDITMVQDDKALHNYNVAFKLNETIYYAKEYVKAIPGNDIMYAMGNDFNYQTASMWYDNMDKLIHYLNQNGTVNARYSTVHEYAQSKIKANLTLETTKDDLFPYANRAHSFWTGYFTSRPALKRYVRDISGYHQMSRMVSAIAGNPTGNFSWLAQAMGLAQHHDAVSGTEKQHVAFDYAQRIAHGVNEDLQHLVNSISNVTGLPFPAAEVATCPLANVSLCPATQSLTSDGRVTVVVWNSLARGRTAFVDIPVKWPSTTVEGLESATSVYKAPHAVTNYLPSNPAAAPYVLSTAVSLPPMGYVALRLKPHATRGRGRAVGGVAMVTTDSTLSIENQFLKLQFSTKANKLTAISNKASNTTITGTQVYCWYESNVGDALSTQRSGAYAFRPTSNQLCTELPPVSLEVVIQTPSIVVVEQKFGAYVTQRLTLRDNARNFEISFTVGPLPPTLGGTVGTEVVYKFVTDIDSQATFYTDSNAREMQKRVRNYRPSWNFTQTEPVAGNYFPVNALAVLNDTKAQLSIATDASHGGGSIRDGELEIMVHRACLLDDWFGVAEPLNETEYVTDYWKCGSNCGKHYGAGLIIRGKHFVMLDTPQDAMPVARALMDEVYAAPRYFFTQAKATTKEASFGGPLPENVQLTTLELVNSTSLLIRVSHQYGVGESPTLSKPATVDLRHVIPSSSKVVKVDEMSLTANMWKRTLTSYEVTINPMDVMTFVATLDSQK